jgi:hypothetical protein
LRVDEKLLTERVKLLDSTVNNFLELMRTASRHSFASHSESAIGGSLRRLFSLYLSAADDVMMLFTGRVCREYHAIEHCELYRLMNNSHSALHDRGGEGAYFKLTDRFSRCSVDGFNYEYRKLIKKRRSDTIEDVSYLLSCIALFQ